MNYDLKLELSPSDVFELKRWLEEIKAVHWTARTVDYRRSENDREREVRLSVLSKIVKGIDEAPHL